MSLHPAGSPCRADMSRDLCALRPLMVKLDFFFTTYKGYLEFRGQFLAGCCMPASRICIIDMLERARPAGARSIPANKCEVPLSVIVGVGVAQTVDM